MGPKGYRICWLGNDQDRMLRLFDDADPSLGEFFFLPYPGTERKELKEVHPSLFLIDTEGLEGYRKELLRWIVACREVTPPGRVLVLLQNGSSRFVFDALLSGADWILHKTGQDAPLRFCVRTVILQHKAEKEVLQCRGHGSGNHVFEDMVGRTTVMKDLGRLIRKCAPSHANVLIRGESGTGKELVARAIHEQSGRKGNLVIVNCAALLDNLHQSELFGHEKGAFTDAKSRRTGYFEAAKDGTLFLDEIGDISASTQTALLRIIEGKGFFRVGGSEPIRVNVRVISATNRNLEVRVQKGDFREDLYYRLNGFCLTVPPLRERREDIPLLAETFLERFSSAEQKEIMGFTPEAMELLCCYHWPGNVREMENEIQRVVIQAESERLISSSLLSPSINILKTLTTPGTSAKASLKTRTQQVEAFFIREALKMHYGNRTRAAEHLGISREGLHKKMARYRIH
jgi:transcriptional regulator with PAS, ATPase and Fis domain